MTDFLDTNYVDLLKEVQADKKIDEIIVLRGSSTKGTIQFEKFLERATACKQKEFAQRKGSVAGEDL